jgi:hypothetical protein
VRKERVVIPYVTLVIYLFAVPGLFFSVKRQNHERESWLNFCLVLKEAILLMLALWFGVDK